MGTDVLRHEYVNCDGDSSLAFFEITGGGHTWPGSPFADQVAGSLGYTTDDVDATADSWAFFEGYSPRRSDGRRASVVRSSSSRLKFERELAGVLHRLGPPGFAVPDGDVQLHRLPTG